MPSLVVRPGGTVRLKQQPEHVPDFVVMACESDRAWIRQPEWPQHIQLCVRMTQLSVPCVQV
ncbi:MAG: hypothetical protein AAF827_08520 [Cyanobacteria bacterium P01_D01_bin.6]